MNNSLFTAYIYVLAATLKQHYKTKNHFMATLKLERTNEYNNRVRNYGVYIDGMKVGEISNGESKSFDVAAGKHNIVCKIDWRSSPTISLELSNEEVVTLKVGGFKSGNWIVPFSLFSSFLLPLLINRVPEFIYLYCLFIQIGGLIIYYLTVGRKKYLTLAEI